MYVGVFSFNKESVSDNFVSVLFRGEANYDVSIFLGGRSQLRGLDVLGPYDGLGAKGVVDF